MSSEFRVWSFECATFKNGRAMCTTPPQTARWGHRVLQALRLAMAHVRRKRNACAAKKGNGIRDEQRGRARRISRGAGDPERGGTAQAGAAATDKSQLMQIAMQTCVP